LAELKLLPSHSKFQGYGIKEISRRQTPEWIKQSKVFKDNEETGEVVPYFGLGL
jgi:hypothetical protein